jgi:glycosyltransferase involved in cell wall biosynthesis
VLCGKIGWGGEYEKVKQTAQAHGLPLELIQAENQTGEPSASAAKVLIINGASDLQLQALYRTTAAIAYPSSYEGFGLPALEALAMGVPLVTANNSSLPEITGPSGETALLIDQLEASQLAHALQRLLTEPELTSRLLQAGRERAAHFTWQNAAHQTLQTYANILSQ